MKTKNLFLILLLSALTLMSCCDPISCDPFDGWPEFPEERFASYAPYEKQENISFKNQKEEYLNLATSFYWYIERDDQFGSKNYGCEEFMLHCKMTNESFSLEYLIGAFITDSKRDEIEAYANIQYNEQNIPLGTQYIEAKNATDFETVCLPDTFKTTDPNTNNYSIIVSGKGLVEFSFNGEIWTLVE